ncbi:MAG TPA: 50S ribosomal protein L6 [Candidatus Nanoarchaeia archaeon]|nr:50S ribosomal protein L6 [Candidatus Nanoarchaeia archaeon]
MRKDYFKEIEIPEGVEVNLAEGGNQITIKGPEGENTKRFSLRKVNIDKKDNKIVIGKEKSTKREKKITNSVAAHISNMIKGVREKFEYTLKVCSSHFPMTVEASGREVTIKNFLGEKKPRKTKIQEGAEININKETITIKSTNKEIAGQAAATIERATQLRKKDRRVFQDGIYITNKAGKEI